MSRQVPLETISETESESELLASEALQSVPAGAFALAGFAVGLLLVAWLFVYFCVFLARGPVG